MFSMTRIRFASRIPRHPLPWQRWALLETVGPDMSWVVSWHSSRRTASWALGRRLVRMDDHGVTGVSMTVVRARQDRRARYAIQAVGRRFQP